MKFITVLKISAGIILIGAGTLIYFNLAPALMQDEEFTVKNGESLKSVAVRLKNRNMIKNTDFFTALAIAGSKNIIKPGKYKIEKGTASWDILKKLSQGDVITKKVTIPEGYNLYAIAERLEKENILSSKRFLKSAFDKSYLKSLGINSISAEGYLFPDTYVFPEESDAKHIIKIMYNQLKKVLNAFSSARPGKSRLNTHKLLTIASLIESEARVPKERVYISAVFHNRLKRGMKLDCDPTVRYAVKKFTGRIGYRDLEYKSPYNTYLNAGLPPTPICSPGRESIKAALKPVDVPFLYFVARNDGSHYFSKTLREHNRAVNYFQKGIRKTFVDKQQL